MTHKMTMEDKLPNLTQIPRQMRNSYNMERRKRIEYRIEYFLSVPSDVVCGICNCVMNEPVKSNGVTYCRLCYLSKPEFSSFENITPYKPDHEIAAKVRQLECYCIYRSEGCEWKGTVEHLDYHLDVCPEKLIQCHYCEDFYHLKEEQSHNSVCTVVKCPCGEVMARNELESHIPHCPKHITCMNCSYRIPQSEFLNHAKQCQDFHCNVCSEIISQKDLIQHVENFIPESPSFAQHLKFIMLENTNFKNQINILNLETLNLKEQVSRHEEKLVEITQVGEGRKDGSLLWVIDNVREKYQAAKEDNKPIFSPSFFSHENGYKMGAKLYLNGDGVGQGKYISLYFFLDKGPFDELLKWPFSNKVALQIMTFGEMDPNIEIFTPEKNALSFEKPKGKRNIPSGFAKFAKQGILHEDTYVQNNKFFLKITTDTANMVHP